MFSCSSTNKTILDTGNNKSDVTLYKEGMKYLKVKDFENAVEVFNELEIVHPYSIFSSKSQLMAGFAQYMANEYEEAILTLTK
jgi:DNA uptake lipoprotein